VSSNNTNDSNPPNIINNDTIVLTDSSVDNQQALLAEHEQADPLSHSTMAHFKIIDILGKGGMGAVYKAKDLALERFVAIKMIRTSQADQPLMLAEAKTISQLNHPNIVTVYDIARDNNANFIVMEWVDGSPLNNVITSNGLSVNTVLNYAKQMVAGIACAHQQGITHRDIKPQNIMVDANNHIKILDFGIAALNDTHTPANTSSTNTNVTNTSTIAGSPQYMAPEHINGLHSDARSDLFSLGIVLYEMLTGVKPFLGLNIQQITQAITRGEYTPLAEHKPELPTALITVVDKLLQVEPTARYQNAEALASDIQAIDEALNHKKNWWQQQHWLTQAMLVIPFIFVFITAIGWGVRDVLFPPSTQELIAQQLVGSKKIAFLPFDNISGDPVLQIFSDGMATMLSSDLAEVGYQQGDGTTWVLPASEIRRLEDPSVTGVYNKYGVDLLVTGSIQHMGSTRSIHLNLVNGADGRQLKSVQLSINANELFNAQTHIRQQVMNLLEWQIPPTLREQFAKHKPAFDGAYKHYLQGQGYLYRFDHADNIAKALASFQAAIEIDPNYADAYVGLAEAKLRVFIDSKDESVLNLIEQIVHKLQESNSEHSLLGYLEGELKLSQGDYKNAIKLFNRSIRLRPSFLKAYAGLSLSYLKLGKSDEAEKTLLNAYQIMPNNNTILTDLGIYYYSNGYYNKAIKYFELLVQQAPNNFTAYLNLSACFYLNGNIQEAILIAEKALRIKKDSNVYANIGTYYFILRKYNRSVEAFENAIALNNSHYANWGNLADAYHFSNNLNYLTSFKQAIVLAEKSVQLNPHNKKAISSLAYYYANLGNLDKVNFHAKQINKKDSGDNQFFIAAAYARLHMNAAALKYLKLAIINNYSIAEIKASPLLDNLKNDINYKQLLVKSEI